MAEQAPEADRLIVFGATGETGRLVVQQALASGRFAEVCAASRRELDAEEVAERFSVAADDDDSAFEQRLVDFEHLYRSEVDPDASDDEQSFDGYTHAVSCFGSTRAKAGSAEEFERVDKHVHLAFVRRLRQAASVRHFTLMSSVGADASSSFLYPRVKGEIEEAVQELGFPRASVFQPSVLLTARKESRKLEWLAQKLWPNWLLPKSKQAVKTERVAEAMLANMWREPRAAFERYDNADIITLDVGAPAQEESA